jgi:hypothetical protein
LNGKKCVYAVQQLKFLGHSLSPAGIKPSEDKVEAIKSFREPQSCEETRSFLGLVTYVGKFVPCLANKTEPLRELIKKDNKFTWSSAQKSAFAEIKSVLSDVDHLGYFNPKDPTRLIADASPVALGAVLVQFEGHKPRIITINH